MLTAFLVNISGNTHWLWGSLFLMALCFLLYVLSLFRNAKTLFWFYMTGFLLAAVLALASQWFPLFMQSLVSLRSDWSLLFLIQNLSISSVLSQLVVYFFVYSLLGIVLVVLLELWSLLTFRWARLRVIFHRILSDSWFVLLFTVSSVIMNQLWFAVFGQIDFVVLGAFFSLMSFLYLFQLYIRLLDNAYLHTPQLFIEYAFAITLLCLFGYMFGQYVAVGLGQQVIAKAFFLHHLTVFFLVILLIGFLSTFFVRAWFASTFFLEHHQRRTSILMTWTSRFFLSEKDRHYAHQRVLMGIVVSIVLGSLFLVMALQEWYLTLIPAYFLGYFLLFYFLDRQDDMRIRGDLVDKRIESAVNKVFFG